MINHEYHHPGFALIASSIRAMLPEARANGVPFQAVNLLHRAIAAIEQADSVMRDASDA